MEGQEVPTVRLRDLEPELVLGGQGADPTLPPPYSAPVLLGRQDTNGQVDVQKPNCQDILVHPQDSSPNFLYLTLHSDRLNS